MTAKQDVKGTTVYTYTSINQLATVAEPSGKLTEYAYDASGNRQSETVSEGSQTVATTYEVNEQNRLLYTEALSVGNSAKTIIEQYFYDDAGNMLGRRPEAFTDISGGENVTENLGLALLGQAEESDLVPALYSYDDKNQMVEAVNAGSTVTNTFNVEIC